MSKSSDHYIVKSLQFGNRIEVNQALSDLHRRVYKQVVTFMTKYYGTTNDAEDVFQDGLLAIYKLARKGELKTDTNMEAYLFTICKNLWFQQLRKRKEIIPLEDVSFDIKIPSVTLFRLMEEEEKQEIQHLISQIGEGYKKVLIYYYYKKIRMQEIAELMNYSSAQVAKNKKSECLKKLKKRIQSSIFKLPKS